ncbi:hypothetical protein ACFSQT_38435 [Mesorhizobium calcicola]|uniref:Uncharacterized protein n=1 Tax=Mesorhizobium calcicola TaxID=1300310 RepID=A0ABW4WQC3_9HYPH
MSSRKNNCRKIFRSSSEPWPTVRRVGYQQASAPQGDELQHGLHPYDDAANIIDGLVEGELSKLGSGRTAKTVRNTASGQRKFSDWLRTMGRESIASRINGDWHQRESLDRDYQEFTKANGNVGIGFKRLAQYVQVVEARLRRGRSGLSGPHDRAG